ncbi:MAG: hypothetical protein LBI57_07005 [Helicobacteraceae bacterium]|jgi:hypothetical protein|nr:hypothetical protein [Helicobacteraceae bacterium]
MRIPIALVFAALWFVGCADKPSYDYELGGLPEKAPAWINDPDVNGRFGAAGGAIQSVGGARFQQIEASARADEILRGRVQKIGFAAAKRCLIALKNDGASVETLNADARLASLMISAAASNQFERVDNWWSPSRDHYALLRIAEDQLKATIVDMIARFVKSNENYSANFAMLQDLKLIDEAAIEAIAAAK